MSQIQENRTGYGFCQCGCGQRTSIAKRSDSQKGAVKGEPRRYVAHHGARGKKYAPEVYEGRVMGRRCPPGCTCGRHSESARSAIAAAHRGMKASDETRKKMSESRKKFLAANPGVAKMTFQITWPARVKKGFKYSGTTNAERMKIYRSTPTGRAILDYHSALRRRRMRENGECELVERTVVFTRDGGVCQLCGDVADPFNFHVDHTIPLAVGGEHSYKNVQLAHPLCNQRKGARV